MTIPFLSYFKRGKDLTAPAKEKEVPAAKPSPSIDKPDSDRFSKTVMPSAKRTSAPQDPFEMAARSTALGGQMAGLPSASSGRTISFSPGAAATAAARDLPPAVALALEPTVERVISIELSDVLTEMPEGVCKPTDAIDTSRRVLLKAAEVEKGMARGKPTVSLASVYQQIPEIFIKRIAETDESQLGLPFQKVLDAFAQMNVRRDQERATAVPQVETPFLKVTIEDNEKFGIVIEPLEVRELPRVRVEPPTAQAFADAEPEEVAEAIRKMKPAPATNGHTPATPKRIPFKLSPNGTDGSAPESVPASSVPSVPKVLPSSPAPVAGIDDHGREGATSPKEPGSTIPATTTTPAATTPATGSMAAPVAPVRIPFKLAMPNLAADEEETKPQSEPWLTKESLAASETPTTTESAAPVAPAPAKSGETKIALPLLPILKNLPPMQLTSDPSCVPPDVRLELPFALIEPQLASGRVSVTAKVFEVSLPVSFRGLFQAGPGAVDVALPLQEVLKNLPAASLRMRDDQEEQEAGQNFATPFSAKAEEDAKRFNVPTKPVAKPMVPEPVAEPQPVVAKQSVEAVVPAATETKAADTAAATGERAADTAAATAQNTDATPAPVVKSSDRPIRTPLQVALGTDEKLDAKGVVALINKMPGIKACSVLFGDGLSLAGSLPAELETDGVCAMAPALMQRIENHLVDTKLGALRGMTLSCVKGSITFYMHENLCLAALHADADLPGETRDKLSRVVHELSRKYSHPV